MSSCVERGHYIFFSLNMSVCVRERSRNRLCFTGGKRGLERNGAELVKDNKHLPKICVLPGCVTCPG